MSKSAFAAPLIGAKSIPALSILALSIMGSLMARRLPLDVLLGGVEKADFGKLYISGIMLAIGIPLSIGVWIRGLPHEAVERVHRMARPFFFVYAFFFFVFIVTLSILKVYSLHTYADLANNLEILWRETHGLGLTSPMFEEAHDGLHWFAAHFAPIAYLIAYPWFLLFPGPETLIVITTIALVSGAIPIMLYARERIGKETGYWIGAAFLMYPTIQFIGIYEFGFLQLSIPFLAWAFYALHKRWMWTYAVFTVLALTCREEVGLVVFAIGLYSAFIRRNWRIGLVTAVLGLGYSLIVILMIIPSFRHHGGLLYLKHFSEFGQTPMEIVGNVFRHPLAVLKYLSEPTRLGNFIMYFLPLQFLSFASPGTLLIALPNIASSFLANAISVYSYFLYYLSPSIPFIFFSAIETMRWMTKKFSPASISLYITSSALIFSVLFGPSPLSFSFWERGYKLGAFHSTNFHCSHYAITEHAKLALEVVRVIPRETVISAEQHFLSHLYDRKWVYVFPTLKSNVEYVLIDKKHPFKSGFNETYLDFRRRPEYYYLILESKPDNWELIKEIDGVMLFHRIGMTRSRED